MFIGSSLVYAQFATNIYRSKTTILPPASNMSRNLGGGLSQFTSLITPEIIGLRNTDVNLYGPILESRKIISTILQKKISLVDQNNDTILMSILGFKHGSLEERLDAAYGHFLKNILEVKNDRKTSITTVWVNTQDPILSSQVAKSLVQELNDYLMKNNINKAKENKVFIVGRLLETEKSLLQSEFRLTEFRKSNRKIENSPDLQTEQARLIREIRIQEEVFITLKKEFELVKIEEVKSMPLLNILDEAIRPINRFWPRKKFILLLGIFLSIISNGIFILMLAFYRRKPEIFEPVKVFISQLSNEIQKFNLHLPINKDRSKQDEINL